MKNIMLSFIIILMVAFIAMGCQSVTDPGQEVPVESLEKSEFDGSAASSTAKSNYKDEDNNGIPDEGEVVTGTYKSLYVYDASGDYYWDLGDGRIYKTVDSIDDLDQETLTTCDYKVQYRGSFENDPSLDSGWIKNNILCKGIEDGNFNYLIVHESDRRYTGNPDWEIWGTWEYHTYAVRGEGNLVRPEKHIN